MRLIVLFVTAYLVFCCVPFLGAGDHTKKGTEVDGTWKLIKYIEDGKPNESEVKANYLIVRNDGVQVITKGGKPFSKVNFEVDPTKTPRYIDFIDDKGTRVGGVYEIEGHEMRVAIFADSEKRKTGRPSDLKEEGNIIAVYERVKDK